MRGDEISVIVEAVHPDDPPVFQLSGRLDIDDPIPGISDTARFHEGWEARIFGVMRTVTSAGLFTVDEFRHAIERLPPDAYHTMSYFERWTHAVQRVLVEKGHLTEADLVAGYERATPDHTHPAPLLPMPPRRNRHLPAPPARQRFAIGARVRLLDGPGDHHRMPVWACGHTGIVTALRGSFALPDLIVDRGGVAAVPEQHALYAVAIPAAAAFAASDPRDVLLLDVYDPYLEEAP